MAVTIHDTTGLMRRIIISDESTDAELLLLNPLRPGELAIMGQQVTQAELNVITRLNPGSGRHAVVAANGDVVNVILCDPAIDNIRDHTLVSHETVITGWRQMRDGSFQRTSAEIDVEAARVEAHKTKLNSRIFRDRQAAKVDGLSPIRIDELIAEEDAKLVVLGQERDDRIQTR